MIKERIPTLIVSQRVHFKKTDYICNFFDGYAIVKYSSPSTAKETFKRMKEQGLNVKLIDDKLFDYWENQTAKEIYENYLRDIEKAMKKNGLYMKIKYKEVFDDGVEKI